MMDRFELDARLAADTLPVGNLALSRVLLMNDARYPWLILVPRRAGLTELHDLAHAEGLVLMDELRRASAGLKSLTGAAKINVGALGNLVPQLHIHVIARDTGDAAWPGPVWGVGEATPYAPGAADALIASLRASQELSLH
jgi:diadenosine tetraphosphate (Ap4A) HIT family hydrolase